MFVICKNDFPIATAKTQEIAEKAKDYLQKLYDVVLKAESEHGGMTFIHIHEVPNIIASQDQFHELFLVSGGRQYDYILNALASHNSHVKAEAIQKFEDFREIYPAIDGFIKRAGEQSEYVKFTDEYLQVPLTTEDTVRSDFKGKVNGSLSSLDPLKIGTPKPMGVSRGPYRYCDTKEACDTCLNRFSCTDRKWS